MTKILTPNTYEYNIEIVKTSTKIKFFTMLEFSKKVVHKPKKK